MDCINTYAIPSQSCEPTQHHEMICQRKFVDLNPNERIALFHEFVRYYPEFQHLLEAKATDAEPDITPLERMLLFTQVKACQFPEYTCVDNDCDRQRFFLFMAHCIATSPDYRNNDPTQAIQHMSSAGVVSSASVGDVSISYDTSLQTAQGGNPLKHYLMQSQYGLMLLASLELSGGFLYIS